MSSEDELQFKALCRLRDADQADRRTEFDNLCALLAQQVMPTWAVMQNYVRPVLSRAGLDLNDIAYLNLLKWRSEDTRADLFNISWKAHTGKQYSILDPAFVIVIGSTTRDRFLRLIRRFGAPQPEILYFLRRSRNDAMPPPESTTKEQIPEVANALATWPHQRGT